MGYTPNGVQAEESQTPAPSWGGGLCWSFGSAFLSTLFFLAEFSEFTDDQLRASDADGDGEISIADATAIQMYAAQLIDHLG